jgi:cell division protein FtsA
MIIGIDVGSHKIAALIGEALPGPKGGIRILGVGHAPAEGIRAGEIVHVDDAAGAIAASVDRAERLAGDTFIDAVVGITGLHVRSRNNAAAVPCGRRPRPIGPEDVARVLDAAGTLPIAAEREVLHVLPRHFRVDDGPAVRDPSGMEAFQLESSVHVVTASQSALNNLRRCLDLAEVAPARLALSTLAAAEASLTEDERQLGVVVADFGHAVTGVACYQEGALVHSATIGLGGRHLTNDLAVVFQTPFAQAERLKQTHGHVLPEHDDERIEVEVTPFGEEASRQVRRRDVSEVLAARVDEIADMVAAEIGEANFADGPPAGVVLVGGGTELQGLARRLHERWALPVRIGRPRDVTGLTDAAGGPGHAAAVGLLMWSQRQVEDHAPLSSVGARNGMMGWMREALLPRRNGRS